MGFGKGTFKKNIWRNLMNKFNLILVILLGFSMLSATPMNMIIELFSADG
jgi:hypothetical protein